MAAFGLDPGSIGYMILIDAYMDAAQILEGPSGRSAKVLSQMLHAEKLFDKYSHKLPDIWMGRPWKNWCGEALHFRKICR
eukprot:jgi/Pico_ML_1/53357/g3918.t1